MPMKNMSTLSVLCLKMMLKEYLQKTRYKILMTMMMLMLMRGLMLLQKMVDAECSLLTKKP